MGANLNDIFSARRAVAVTKSDTTVLEPTRGLWVGGAGNLSVILSGDTSAVTLNGAAAGMVYPLSVIKVMAATTATGVVALY